MQLVGDGMISTVGFGVWSVGQSITEKDADKDTVAKFLQPIEPSRPRRLEEWTGIELKNACLFLFVGIQDGDGKQG